MLSVIYTECRNKVYMLSVNLQNVIMLSVIYDECHLC
jgi:hypothetical protein